MDVFNLRISMDETAAIVQAALRCELLSGHSSAIIHHLGLMRSRIAALCAAFPETALHTIAIKANPVVGILREVVQAGAGLEAASIEEVHLALAAGCTADRVIFDSPAKTHAEIQQALRLGVQRGWQTRRRFAYDSVRAAHRISILHQLRSCARLCRRQPWD
jgi:diaminopimelate decarboxylase